MRRPNMLCQSQQRTVLKNQSPETPPVRRRGLTYNDFSFRGVRHVVSGAEGLDWQDFSTGCACVSHAFDVLGVCVIVTSALLRTETER